MSKPKTFKNVAECFFTALVIIFKKKFDFFSSVSEKIKTNIPENSSVVSESTVVSGTMDQPVEPVQPVKPDNPLVHSVFSIP